MGVRTSLSLTVVGNFSLLAMSFCTGILVARLLGPAGRGELAAIQVVPGLVGAMAVIGIPNAIGLYTARDPKSARSIWLTGAAMATLASLLGMAVALFLIDRMLQGQSPATLQAARLFVLYIPLQVLSTLPLWSVQGLGRFGLWNILRVLSASSWLMVVLIAVATGRREPGFLSTVYLWAYAGTIPLTVGGMFYATSGRMRLDRAYALEMIRFGAPTALGYVPVVLNQQLALLLMAAMLPVEILGIYAVARSWGGVVVPVLGAVGSVIFPLLARLRDGAVQREALARILRATVLIAGIFVLGTMCMTPLALPWLLGPGFEGSVPIALILVVAGGITGLGGILQEALRGLGAPIWPTIAEFAGLAATTLLLLFFLRQYQGTGAAIASLGSTAVVATVAFYGVVRVTKLRLKDALLPTIQEWRELCDSPHRLLRTLRALFRSVADKVAGG